MPGPEEKYITIRDILGRFIGRTVVDITQHDEEEYRETQKSFVEILFDNGETVRFMIGEDGFYDSEYQFWWVDDEDNSETD